MNGKLLIMPTLRDYGDYREFIREKWLEGLLRDVLGGMFDDRDTGIKAIKDTVRTAGTPGGISGIESENRGSD